MSKKKAAGKKYGFQKGNTFSPGGKRNETNKTPTESVTDTTDTNELTKTRSGSQTKPTEKKSVPYTFFQDSEKKNEELKLFSCPGCGQHLSR